MQINIKKAAFSLAEIMIVLMIVAFIAWPFIQAAKKGTRHYTNSLFTYSAFDSLTNAAYDMSQIGCTVTDMGTTSPYPYCNGTTGVASTGFIPWYIHTTDGSNPNRGFCDRLANDEFNSIGGSINCSNSPTITSGVLSGSANFITTNGMRFYFAASGTPNPSAKSATGVYTLYVDIDGSKRNSRTTESGTGRKDVDVVKFLVKMDGTVVPDPDSIAANDTDYLSVSVRYMGSTDYVYVMTNAPYRQAACNADPTKPQAIVSDYCTAAHGYSVYSQAAICTTNACEIVIEKPGMMGNN